VEGPPPVTLRDVYEARARISGFIRRTPLVENRFLSRLLGARVLLKLESLQVTGSFKVRGALNFVLSRREEVERRGVVTVSTGNHAQGVAYAASIVGGEAVIVMPRGVPAEKVEAVRELGAEVVIAGSTTREARAMAERIARERGMIFLHPAGAPEIVAGAATLHLEVAEDSPRVDAVVVPVGSGGGLAGAVVVHGAVTGARVYGVQAEGAQSFYQSWLRGEPVSTGRVETVAEGLASSAAHPLTLAIARRGVKGFALVSDEEIIEAMCLLMRAGVVAEASAAASLAGALKLGGELGGGRVVLVITGGNVSGETLRMAMERGVEGCVGST